MLRKISIGITIASISLFVGMFSLLEESPMTPESKVTDDPNRDGPLMPLLLILLFSIPASIAGIIASFSKTIKFQILVWVVTTIVFWTGISLFGLWLLIDPVYFDLPENYWNTLE